tara:strand:+ start:35085 stop:35789 length:705 start_codon:yes stop_codon:yes gene_type:complete
MEIKFNDTEYTEAALAGMTVEDLLVLRNEVAVSLGVAEVKGFKDQAAGASQTWKALQRHAKGVVTAEKKEAKAKAPPKERGLAKSAESKTVKRPNKKMFSTITKTGEHDGTQGRTHRWPNYSDGMTLVDIIETEGTEPWDAYNWVGAGIMTITEPTEAEFVERKAAWYTKHGLTDPEAAKAAKAVERGEAKEARDKAAAEKKAEREAAKEAKVKERTEAAEAKAAEAKTKASAE